MAIDSREKGKRGEYLVRDALRKKTAMQWERVPGSGAFGANHGLKGDVYLPSTEGHASRYCFEVKWYKDEQLTSNILNNGVSQIEKWWDQTAREAVEMNLRPALVFKKDRGQWLIALDSEDPLVSKLAEYHHVIFSKKDTTLVIGVFEVWLNKLSIEELVKTL